MSKPTLHLTPTDRAEWLVPVGFAALILLTYAVGLLAGTIVSGAPTLPDAVYSPILFPGLFSVAPVVVGAANTYRGGSLATTVVAGAAPGVTFFVLAHGSALLGLSDGGDAPAWGLALVFAGVGVAGALAGVVAVAVGWTVRERLGRE